MSRFSTCSGAGGRYQLRDRVAVDQLVRAGPGGIGVGFAIPIDQAKPIAKEIIDTGTAAHSVFGAAVSDNATSATAIPDGALLGEITTGGPANSWPGSGPAT